MLAADHPTGLYALVAEFEDSSTLLKAAKRTCEAGYTLTDAHSPIPIHGLAEALGMVRTKLPWIVFFGGLLGCLGGFFLQYWVSVIEYPLNVGGRPLNSWPSFVPVTFECTILGAALATVIGMLSLNGLPRPNHPIFNTPGFARASDDRFFLAIEADDPRFDETETMAFLKKFKPLKVSRAEHSDPRAPLLIEGEE